MNLEDRYNLKMHYIHMIRYNLNFHSNILIFVRDLRKLYTYILLTCFLIIFEIFLLSVTLIQNIYYRQLKNLTKVKLLFSPIISWSDK